MVSGSSGVRASGASSASASAAPSNEGSKGRGKLGMWPWLLAALLLLGGLTAIDLAFYRGEEDHGVEEEHDEDGVEELETTG